MVYVAVKGGAAAINAAHGWTSEVRRGSHETPLLSLAQIDQQLGRAIDRVMAEGALYDRDLAARAIRQAQGDLIEAAFLLRAYRTTLPRLVDSQPIDTAAMAPHRRISAIFKDLPGGQRLGPTMDYMHRLLDFGPEEPPPPAQTRPVKADPVPRATDMLGAEALIEPDGDATSIPDHDLTMEPLGFPASRTTRLQALARGDEGFLLAMG